jgi:uncharacterized protein YbaP (TraB family)
MRFFLLFICLTAGWTLRGQESSLLWRVERDGIFHGYVFGTMHLGIHAAVKDTSVLFDRMNECTIFSPELDLTDMEGIQMEMMGKLMYPEGLPSLYSQEEWLKVDSLLEAEFGEGRALYFHLKPFWISLMLTKDFFAEEEPNQEDEGFQRAVDPLDVVLTRFASRGGMPIEALETPMDQINSIDAIPISDQAAELYKVAIGPAQLGQIKGKSMIDCYGRKDLQCIEEMYADSPLSPMMEEFLLTRRNRHMAVSLNAKLMQKKTVFCAIGAMHLPGADGVLALLRSFGYQVTPVVY